ncbi:MAG TPA: DinB family protein [Thermoanaerobaculia bacterium]|nr:DinB family protein [Thermoanaerobaculia bacterium]
MDGQALAKTFEFSHMALTRNLEGVTHEESLRAPEPGGNALNWVLGHILYHRNMVMNLLGQPPVWDPDKAARYARGSAPLAPGEDPQPFEEMRAELDKSQEPLVAALQAATEEQLAAPAENGKPLFERLTLLGFHEGYHGGQIGLLRRILGHPGAIQ